MRYDNPIPVAVHLQEVTDGHRAGLLLIRRADNGGWAFPGGYVETQLDASAETAAAREFREETGISVAPGIVTSTVITPGGQLLIFVSSTIPLPVSALGPWRPTAEASAIRIAYQPETLCFPLHTAAMRRWFGLT